ncbi:MAG: AAA family ATPase [Thermoanaerobaculia bacterium]
MRIKVLSVSGFRSLRDVEWLPRDLNVLIGPNGSGKSNLLQVLDLLQKAAAGKLSEEILRQGGIVPLLYDERAQTISWILKTTSATEEGRFLYHLTLQRLGLTSSFRIRDEILKGDRTRLLERDTQHINVIDRLGTSINLGSLVPEDEAALSRLDIPTVSSPEASEFHRRVLGWDVYHNFRVDRDAPLRQAAVARLERKIAPDGQNLIPVLHTLYSGNREFKGSVDAAMRAAFGTEYEELVFPPAADQRVQLRIRWRSLKTEQSAANLSDGTLRFLLLLAILANPEPGDLIAIDEPETGLHPGMFPIIAELATAASERTQMIFTTHSPQFLDAFREKTPTTTVAEWVDGETRLSVLDGDDLQKWLQEYSLGELYRSGGLEAFA